MTRNERTAMDATHDPSNSAIAGPETDRERELVTVLLANHRRAGRGPAWGLLDRMSDAGMDGASCDDLRQIAREALANLPVRQ